MKIKNKKISILVVVSFLINIVNVYSYPRVNSLQQKNLFILDNIGKVVDHYEGQQDKKIYIIEDAHCNIEAQEKITQIIEAIRKYNNIKKIILGIEGNVGKLDTKLLNNLKDGELKDYIIKNLLDNGYINAWELYNVKHKGNAYLYGLEDKNIYEQNFRYLYKSLAYRDFVNDFHEKVSKIIKTGKEKVYPTVLLDFEQLEKDYQDKKIQFKDWIKILEKNKNKYKVLADYKNINIWKKIDIISKKLNMQQVSMETKIFVNELIKHISKKEIKILKSLIGTDYYKYLSELINKYNIVLTEHYVNLSQYLDIVVLSKKLNTISLMEETKDLTVKIKQEMVKGKKGSEEVLYCAENLELLKNYINNNATKNEVGRCISETETFLKKLSILNKKISPKKYIEENKAVILNMLKIMTNFYAKANKRDEILSKNLLKIMDKKNEKIAVMVVGGYHGEGISRLLRAQGIGYERIRPTLLSRRIKNVYIDRIKDQARILGIQDTLPNIKMNHVAKYLALAQFPDVYLQQKISSILQPTQRQRTFSRAAVLVKLFGIAAAGFIFKDSFKAQEVRLYNYGNQLPVQLTDVIKRNIKSNIEAKLGGTIFEDLGLPEYVVNICIGVPFEIDKHEEKFNVYSTLEENKLTIHMSAYMAHALFVGVDINKKREAIFIAIVRHEALEAYAINELNMTPENAHKYAFVADLIYGEDLSDLIANFSVYVNTENGLFYSQKLKFSKSDNNSVPSAPPLELLDLNENEEFENYNQALIMFQRLRDSFKTSKGDTFTAFFDEKRMARMTPIERQHLIRKMINLYGIFKYLCTLKSKPQVIKETGFDDFYDRIFFECNESEGFLVFMDTKTGTLRKILYQALRGQGPFLAISNASQTYTCGLVAVTVSMLDLIRRGVITLAQINKNDFLKQFFWEIRSILRMRVNGVVTFREYMELQDYLNSNVDWFLDLRHMEILGNSVRPLFLFICGATNQVGKIPQTSRTLTQLIREKYDTSSRALELDIQMQLMVIGGIEAVMGASSFSLYQTFLEEHIAKLSMQAALVEKLGLQMHAFDCIAWLFGLEPRHIEFEGTSPKPTPLSHSLNLYYPSSTHIEPIISLEGFCMGGNSKRRNFENVEKKVEYDDLESKDFSLVGTRILAKASLSPFKIRDTHSGIKTDMQKLLPTLRVEVVSEKDLFIGAGDGNFYIDEKIAELLEKLKEMNEPLYQTIIKQIAAFENAILAKIESGMSSEEAEREVMKSDLNTDELKAFRNMLEIERNLSLGKGELSLVEWNEIFEYIKSDVSVLPLFPEINKRYLAAVANNGILGKEIVIPVTMDLTDINMILQNYGALIKSGEISIILIGDLTPENISKLSKYMIYKNIKWVMGRKTVDELLSEDAVITELYQNKLAVISKVRQNGEILIASGFVGKELKVIFDTIVDEMTDGVVTECESPRRMSDIINGLFSVLVRLGGIDAFKGKSVEEIKDLLDDRDLTEIVHGVYNVDKVAKIVYRAVDAYFNESYGILNTTFEDRYESSNIMQTNITGYSAVYIETNISGLQVQALVGHSIPVDGRIANVAKTIELRGKALTLIPTTTTRGLKYYVIQGVFHINNLLGVTSYSLVNVLANMFSSKGLVSLDIDLMKSVASSV